VRIAKSADVRHARQLEQRVQQQMLVSRQVGNDDLEQEVRVAGHDVAGDDLVHLGDGLLELLGPAPRLAGHLDLDERGEPEPDLAPIEDRAVAADRALVLEALERRILLPWTITRMRRTRPLS
jgi:hypothetical protein